MVEQTLRLIGVTLQALERQRTPSAVADETLQARPVMEVYPYAWAFFVPFILIATFTVLNLFIAVVVNAMQGAQHESEAHTDAVITAATHDEAERLRGEIGQLREEIADPRRVRLRHAAPPPVISPATEPSSVPG